MPVVSRIKANKDKVMLHRPCSENLPSDKYALERQFVFHDWQKPPVTLFRWWSTIPLFSNTSTRLGSTDTGITPPPASSACCWPSTFVMRWDQQNLWDRWRGLTLQSRVLLFWSGDLWHGRVRVLHLLQVSVFGFGADQYGNWHHYWEENHLAGAFRHTGIHDGDYEYNVTLLLADKQKIRMFKGRWYVDDQPVNVYFLFFPRRGLVFLPSDRRSFRPRAIDEAKATLPVVS